MDKEVFLHQLRGILREVTCMSSTTFEESFKENTIKFTHYCWGEEAKINSSITMRKIESEQ